MRLILVHPSYARLSRFADGELAGRRHTRVAKHLARCAHCRDEVAFIRRAGELARAIPTPSPADEILDGILARRRSGERIILPTTDTGAAVRWRRWLPTIILVLAALIAALALSARVFEAKKVGLRLLPEHPGRGDALSVQYHDADLFAGEYRLRLRAARPVLQRPARGAGRSV